MNVNKIVIFLIVCNYLISQSEISTKEYSYFINNKVSNIDVMKLINEDDGIFKVQLINIDQLKFIRKKIIIMERCEFQLSLSSEITNTPIEYKICKQKISIVFHITV